MGSVLVPMLESQGHNCRLVSRSDKADVRWDYKKQYIDEGAMDDIDYIIHLAGAGIADARWTMQRKIELQESRVLTALLLAKAVEANPGKIKGYLGASAVGYYGSQGSTWLDENSPAGSGFMADMCQDWEDASMAFSHLGLRTCIMRIGIVLTKTAGALPEMTKMLPIGPILGSGKQYLPVIHVEDLARLFVQAVEDESMQGIYNAVGPEPIQQKDLVKQAAAVRNKLYIPAPAPAPVLRIMLGQMAAAVLQSNRVKSIRLQETGFEFKYPTAKEALEAIYR